MHMNRREFLQLLAVAAASGMVLDSKSALAGGPAPASFYDVPRHGNVSFLHFTDCHAQLLPVWFREPNVNLGIGNAVGKAPHLVGQHLLKKFGIKPGSAEAHAFSYLNFTEAAKVYGKVGGFAHLKTLVDKMRAQRPNALLLDGGDTWQGSATSLWTNAQDMVDACIALGVDIMTPHWESTFGADRVMEIVNKDFKQANVDFVAQNIITNDFGDQVFKPYTMKEMNGVKVAVIGQAFPYTPIANPRYMVPDWSFGIRDDSMQKWVDEARAKGAKVVVVLSHNGMDVDIKMASRVTGIDAIFGGHTHDGVPQPVPGQKCQGHHARHQRRFQRQVPRRDGLRRQGQPRRQLQIPPAAGILQPAAGRPGDGRATSRKSARPTNPSSTKSSPSPTTSSIVAATSTAPGINCWSMR